MPGQPMNLEIGCLACQRAAVGRNGRERLVRCLEVLVQALADDLIRRQIQLVQPRPERSREPQLGVRRPDDAGDATGHEVQKGLRFCPLLHRRAGRQCRSRSVCCVHPSLPYCCVEDQVRTSWRTSGRPRRNPREPNRLARHAVVRPALRCRSMLRGSFQRKLKSSGHNPGNADVFVQFFPTKRVTVHLKPDFSQLLRRRILEPPEAVCRESDDPAIRKLQKHHPLFHPDADSSRLGRNSEISDCGTHETSA